MTLQGIITPPAIVAAHRRLTHPGEIGHQFKRIGLSGQGAAPPPGPQT